MNFRIQHPVGTNLGLSFWLRQTNFRNVATNGQQAQRDQLEFLKPGQTDFSITLSRRASGQTVPHGYSISRITGPQPDKPFRFEPTGSASRPTGRHSSQHEPVRSGDTMTSSGTCLPMDCRKPKAFASRKMAVMFTPCKKPELTLLEDSDSDGVADTYRSVANGFRYTGQYHEFAYGPVINSAGELFFSTGLSFIGTPRSW